MEVFPFRFGVLCGMNKKEIEGRSIAKRGRIPGVTVNLRLVRIIWQI